MEDNRKLGIGGAPTRATSLPVDSKERKTFPVAAGFMDYFPDAIAAIANVSYHANEQHHPGQPVNWERSKSTDEADTMMRHFLQRGTLDLDGLRHTAKMVWRAMALLQKEIESEVAFDYGKAYEEEQKGVEIKSYEDFAGISEKLLAEEKSTSRGQADKDRTSWGELA
jgi:hypothetical protein